MGAGFWLEQGRVRRFVWSEIELVKVFFFFPQAEDADALVSRAVARRSALFTPLPCDSDLLAGLVGSGGAGSHLHV